MPTARRFLTAYESKVLDEMALHIVEPNLLSTYLKSLGKPVERFLDWSKTSKIPFLSTLGEYVPKKIEQGLLQALKIASYGSKEERVFKRFEKAGARVTDFADVHTLNLALQDKIADSYRTAGTALTATSGAVLGLGAALTTGTPGAQILMPTIVGADVMASMTLFSRHARFLAGAYGYNPNQQAVIPHIIASMTPHTAVTEEGFLTVKIAAAKTVKTIMRDAMPAAGIRLTPSFVALVRQVAARLGILITEKELAMLIPLGGAVINAGVNGVFLNMGHVMGKDYFRRLRLEEKYGDEMVTELLQGRVERMLLDRNRNAPM